jgi:response regulator RpfG family c-di-GMP phosphodiesterase
MNRRILCVDDEPNVLEGYRRALRKDFDITIAEGGAEALALIKNSEEFAVIMSDMRMPVMDGVQFLRYVREASPNSVRMMLTGNADQQTAIDAVNEGNIFRFLNKPCSPEHIANALNAGLEQYNLITAEKVLLSETLNNSLQVMVEILALVNPTAFSRSNRVKRMARDIAANMGMKKVWEVEIAAMLSQIGCLTVPEDILFKISRCQALDEKELRSYQQHPQIGHDLIARIPRMGAIAQIIGNQNQRFNDGVESDQRTDQSDDVKLGSRILKTVLDFDKLLDAGNLPHQALKELSARIGWYDSIVLESLRRLVEEAVEEFVEIEISVHRLKPGMLLARSVYSTRDVLLLSEKQEITVPLIMKLISLAEMGTIEEIIQVSVPMSKFQVEGLPQLTEGVAGNMPLAV